MQFATCNVKSAKEFIQKSNPDIEIDFDKLQELIRLIEKDILRVQDPMMHYPVQIVAGKKFHGMNKEIERALDKLKQQLDRDEKSNSKDLNE